MSSQVEGPQRDGEVGCEIDDAAAGPKRRSSKMIDAACIELTAQSRFSGSGTFVAVRIAKGRGCSVSSPVDGDQSVICAVDIEGRIKGREVDRETADACVVEGAEVRVQCFGVGPRR